MNDPSANSRTSRNWLAVVQWRRLEAEARINLVRIASVAVFYFVHLAHHWAAGGNSFFRALGMETGEALSERMHIAVTCIAVAWIMLALLIHRLLAEQIFPRWLAFATVLMDTALLTAVLALSSGAASALVAGYFLIIIMAGLRLDLPVVYAATAASVAGYLLLLGCAKWPMGMLKSVNLPIIPRYEEITVVAAMLLAGVLVGQWLRHARLLADDLSRSPRENA